MFLGVERKLDRRLMRSASVMVVVYAIAIFTEMIVERSWSLDFDGSVLVPWMVLLLSLAITVYFGFQFAWGAAYLVFAALALNEIVTLGSLWFSENVYEVYLESKSVFWWTNCKREIKLIIDLSVIWLLFQSSYRMSRAETVVENR